MMKFVCPQPGIWTQVHETLLDAWRHGGSQGLPPPVPLILAGWAYTNDTEKHSRWLATIQWAGESGLESLIPDLRPDERYEVLELSTTAVGPGYGPAWLPRSNNPKPAPAPDALDAALRRLRDAWREVAGDDLWNRTHPVRFCGKKGRRLLVAHSAGPEPPWGAWDRLATGPARRAFTEFRLRVNDAIAPHLVDHVDFIATDALQKEKPKAE